MISTSNYENMKNTIFKTCSISGDRGKKAKYKGNSYPELAPKLSFWKKMVQKYKKISEEENNKYYIKEYWEQILSKLDPQEVYDKLDHTTLLCYENNDEFCHRHIVAEWFQILLDIEIPEIKVEDEKIKPVERPKYIKYYLEKTMKENRNMRGFESLRALYMFEKSEQLESQGLTQAACDLRCQADSVEEQYQNLIKGPQKCKKR